MLLSVPHWLEFSDDEDIEGLGGTTGGNGGGGGGGGEGKDENSGLFDFKVFLIFKLNDFLFSLLNFFSSFFDNFLSTFEIFVFSRSLASCQVVFTEFVDVDTSVSNDSENPE